MRWTDVLALLGPALAHRPPEPEGVRRIPSGLLPGADVSYKEVPVRRAVPPSSSSSLSPSGP